MCFSSEMETLIEKEVKRQVDECFSSGEALERVEQLFSERVGTMTSTLGLFSKNCQELSLCATFPDDQLSDIRKTFNIAELVDEEISGVFYKGEEQERALTFYMKEFDRLSSKIKTKLEQGC